jgi:hypothetical protein
MLNTKLMLNIFVRLRFALYLLAFLTMGTFLAGCAHEPPVPREVARALPQAPDRLMKPVAVPSLYKGQDARAALRLTGTALIEANARLTASAGWYEGVRKSYGAK